MKKVVALLMTAVLTMGMATAAFAAPSPAATTGTVSEATDSNGNAVAVVASDTYAPEDQAAVTEIKADAEAVLEDVVSNVDASDYNLAVLEDISIEGIGDVTFPIKVTISVAGVTAGSSVIVLHYVNGAWTQETATAGDGTVTITLNSLSPVAIYVEADNSASNGNANANANAGTGSNTSAAGNGSGSTGTNANGAKVSPKTGAAPTMTFVVVIAAAAAAGMCVTAKKKNA